MLIPVYIFLTGVLAVFEKKWREESEIREKKWREESEIREKKWREEYDKKSKNEEKIRRTSKTYQEIIQVQRDAYKVCLDWTNTKCENSEDFIRLAELYAKEQAIENKLIRPNLWGYGRMNSDELKILNNYRRLFSDFFTNDIDYNNLPRFPTIREFKTFTTLHWTLAMTNNVMKVSSTYPYTNALPEDKPYHKFALDEISKRNSSTANDVKNIQNVVRPEFLKIRFKLTKQMFKASSVNNDKLE